MFVFLAVAQLQPLLPGIDELNAVTLVLERTAIAAEDRLPSTAGGFLYLPLEHAEDIELQEKGVQLFGPLIARAPEKLRPLLENFASYARRHRDLIRTFGRFPHGNKISWSPVDAGRSRLSRIRR